MSRRASSSRCCLQISDGDQPAARCRPAVWRSCSTRHSSAGRARRCPAGLHMALQPASARTAQMVQQVLAGRAVGADARSSSGTRRLGDFLQTGPPDSRRSFERIDQARSAAANWSDSGSRLMPAIWAAAGVRCRLALTARRSCSLRSPSSSLAAGCRCWLFEGSSRMPSKSSPSVPFSQSSRSLLPKSSAAQLRTALRRRRCAASAGPAASPSALAVARAVRWRGRRFNVRASSASRTG